MTDTECATYSCQCGATGVAPKYGSVADQTPHGWANIGTGDGKIIKLCQACATTVGGLADQIFKALGEKPGVEYVYLAHLLKINKPRSAK